MINKILYQGLLIYLVSENSTAPGVLEKSC